MRQRAGSVSFPSFFARVLCGSLSSMIRDQAIDTLCGCISVQQLGNTLDRKVFMLGFELLEAVLMQYGCPRTFSLHACISLSHGSPYSCFLVNPPIFFFFVTWRGAWVALTLFLFFARHPFVTLLVQC